MKYKLFLLLFCLICFCSTAYSEDLKLQGVDDNARLQISTRKDAAAQANQIDSVNMKQPSFKGVSLMPSSLPTNSIEELHGVVYDPHSQSLKDKIKANENQDKSTNEK